MVLGKAGIEDDEEEKDEVALTSGESEEPAQKRPRAWQQSAKRSESSLRSPLGETAQENKARIDQRHGRGQDFEPDFVGMVKHHHHHQTC